MDSFLLLLAAAGCVNGAALDHRQATPTVTVTVTGASSTVPQYFQTTPELFASITATGTAPFLVETNPAPFGVESSFVPNQPLETVIPIAGNTNDSSIFYYMGNLSPYFPSPGFGADEYPLPPGANVTHVYGLSRHGSRYPTTGSSVTTFGQKIQNITRNGTAHFTGELSFLNSYTYSLGAEILVPQGRAELYNSGVLQYYQYGRLYNTSTKIIARTTTQDRMVKSAENFMAGFFGLAWTNNATLELIIDQVGFNNSLAGYNQCNVSNSYQAEGGDNASTIWESIYLKNAQARFNSLGNYNWSISDVYNAQTMCPYETIAYGYSAFCDLFTFEEWQGFEYTIDLQFDGTYGFAAPTGRAIGIGWVEELYARLQGHLYNLPPGSTQVNTTLDEMIFEIIKTPAPVKANRPATDNATSSNYYESGNATTYVHVTLNQRTIPLNASYTKCPARADGWCELDSFMSVLSGLLAVADYEYACFGNYPSVPFGNITNGVEPPPKKRALGKRALGGGMGTGLSIGGRDIAFLDRM